MLVTVNTHTHTHTHTHTLAPYINIFVTEMFFVRQTYNYHLTQILTYFGFFFPFHSYLEIGLRILERYTSNAYIRKIFKRGHFACDCLRVVMIFMRTTFIAMW